MNVIKGTFFSTKKLILSIEVFKFLTQFNVWIIYEIKNNNCRDIIINSSK